MLELIFGFIVVFFIWFSFMVGHFAPSIISIFFAIFYLAIRYIIRDSRKPKNRKK